MSILIRGMEMPKKGEYKPLFIYDTGEVTMEIRGEEVKVATAVPVPPHGRLIDADDFIRRMRELVRKAETDGFDLGAAWYTAFIRHIELAPAIIPAEEGM